MSAEGFAGHAESCLSASYRALLVESLRAYVASCCGQAVFHHIVFHNDRAHAKHLAQ